MELISVEDDEDKGLIFRKESKSGFIEIGVFRVMFGWRVRQKRADRMDTALFCRDIWHNLFRL